jgi:hypothetical protein
VIDCDEIQLSAELFIGKGLEMRSEIEKGIERERERRANEKDTIKKNTKR